MHVRRRTARSGRVRVARLVLAAGLAAAALPLVALPAEAEPDSLPTAAKVRVEVTRQSSGCDTRVPDECFDRGPETEASETAEFVIPGGGSVSIETTDQQTQEPYERSGDASYRGCGAEPYEDRGSGAGWRDFTAVVRAGDGTEVARHTFPSDFPYSQGYYHAVYYYSNYFTGNACEGPYEKTYTHETTSTATLVPVPLRDFACGGGRLSRSDVSGVLSTWDLDPADRADIQRDPCVLTRDWAAWIPTDGVNWTMTDSRAAGDQLCGTFEWGAYMDLRWRGRGIAVDSPDVKVVQRNICWDKLRRVFTDGTEGGRPQFPTVEFTNVVRFFPLQVVKSGIGGSGVSSCGTTGSQFGNRVEPAGGWYCVLEANITFSGGVPVGFLTTGGSWTRETPVLDFWRFPGSTGA